MFVLDAKLVEEREGASSSLYHHTYVTPSGVVAAGLWRLTIGVDVDSGEYLLFDSYFRLHVEVMARSGSSGTQ